MENRCANHGDTPISVNSVVSSWINSASLNILQLSRLLISNARGMGD